MNPHELSERVDLRDLFDVENPATGKDVADAWLHLESREGPSPPRRLLCIKTDDGAIYRFQRYDTDEFFAFYDRRHEGRRTTKANQLPAHVEAVRRAVMDKDVLPDFEQMVRAEAEVGERDPADAASDEEVAEAVADVVASDGGRPVEVDRAEESSLRSGYYAGDRWPSADESTVVGTDVSENGGGQ